MATLLSNLGVHSGVTCDVCGISGFAGTRYKCTTCYDYDLCPDCYTQRLTSQSHSSSHEMQIILPTEKKHEDKFASFLSQLEGASVFYSCPFCMAPGLGESALVEHCLSVHGDDGSPQTCPICASRPGGNPNYVSKDFFGHLELRHGANLNNRGGGGGSSSLAQALGRANLLSGGKISDIPIRAKKRKGNYMSTTEGLDNLLRSAGFKTQASIQRAQRERERSSSSTSSTNSQNSELDQDELSKRVFVHELLYSSLFS